MYIYTNKEENRIWSKNPRTGICYMSGVVDVKDYDVRFNPIVMEGTLWQKFCNLFSDMKMVEVKERIFLPVDLDNTLESYVWVLDSKGEIYRV